MPTKRNEAGQFVRIRALWTPETWDDGYVDGAGRFRVYRPDYPRAYGGGYALRAHVVWWLAHESVHPKGTNLHHIDGNRSNDVLENLKLLSHAVHSTEHNTDESSNLSFVCEHCGKTFVVKRWRMRQREREGYQIRFCSNVCCTSHPQSMESKERKSKSLIEAHKTKSRWRG